MRLHATIRTTSPQLVEEHVMDHSFHIALIKEDHINQGHDYMNHENDFGYQMIEQPEIVDHEELVQRDDSERFKNARNFIFVNSGGIFPDKLSSQSEPRSVIAFGITPSK
ncbi:hypothetical protein HAX54_048562 [Datura stramonium]|uniref:Uncharacterized protein n=1 Tax=Datura stramonium TaxID=4076 RepID=A0ABS8SUQ1_DATST|nr:hypothetical protein [Datura stramonium]